MIKLLNLKVKDEVYEILSSCKGIIMPEKRLDFIDLSLGGKDNMVFEVKYEVEGKGEVVEAIVTRCKNGIVVNYTDVYMRRRDPDSLIIGDDGETDKQRYKDIYGDNFERVRKETFEWLKKQELVVYGFYAGGKEHGYPALVIAPLNAAFFGFALADIQGFIPKSEFEKD